MFTPKDFTGDNQQPSAEKDLKVSAKVQRLDSEESTNKLSTSVRQVENLLLDDIVRTVDITYYETTDLENKESLG